ncbi:HipA domain-containing protein [Aliidiomarina iranensis]|uniref:HipA domain-containing protein n=1 Tax=Aliidiomarina iranensis TaxID=1434071 RepID=UPI001F5484E4|nr:HipA domain-containing protein [Aliidiomarina iranensis]
MNTLAIYMNGYRVGYLSRSDSGAQEKTALLKIDNVWCIPKGNTPTTHIIKLPVGKIQSHDHTIDLTDSVENEMLCLRIAKAFGFDAPAKNFSIHIEPHGTYRLTPLYDIISAHTAIGGNGLNIPDLKLAMSLRGSSGKKWRIYQIFRRHFLNTAKEAEFSPSRMSEIITTLCNKVDDVIERVKNDLPDDFPTRVSTPIFEGMLERKRRLLIE